MKFHLYNGDITNITILLNLISKMKSRFFVKAIIIRNSPLKPKPFVAAIDNRYDQFDEHRVGIFSAFLTFLTMKYADIMPLIVSYYSLARVAYCLNTVYCKIIVFSFSWVECLRSELPSSL